MKFYVRKQKITLSHFQDSAYEKSATASEKFLRENGSFLANYLKWHFRENFEKPTVEYLQGVANIRLCLDRAAELLFEFCGPSGK